MIPAASGEAALAEDCLRDLLDSLSAAFSPAAGGKRIRARIGTKLDFGAGRAGGARVSPRLPP